MIMKICVIGGGTGTIAVLMGLKKHENIDISVIVGMADDGGSNRVIRDEFGLLPLSDLRKSIIGLAGKGNGMLRQLFTYRFSKGLGLSEHTLGNLIMIALSDLTGSEQGAIEACSKLFDVKGKIIPVTYDKVKLTAEYDNGNISQGEHIIDEPEENVDAKITRLFLSPKAEANLDAVKAIMEADYLIIGPGDLYTSILANIIVQNIPETIHKSKAKIIFINNLMTKQGQTHWMKASDLVEELAKYIGKYPDIVINNNKAIPNNILKTYKDKEGEMAIEDNLDILLDKCKILRANVIGDEEIKRQEGDTLKRSLIRHDPDKLAKIIVDLVNELES